MLDKLSSKYITTEKSQDLSGILSFLNRVSAIPDCNFDFKTGAIKIFEEVCNYTTWPIGHLYILSEDNPSEYISNDIWHLDPKLDATAIAKFKKMTEDTVFIKGKGLIGQIAEDKKSKSLADVTIIEKFLRAQAAKESGVHRFFGFPVVVRGECIGIAEFYGRDIGLIDETSLEIMQYVSAQLARLYEQDQAKIQKQKLINKFESEVQTTIQDLLSNTSNLTEVGHLIQNQATQNTDHCHKLVERKNSISENLGSLKMAMGLLNDTQSKTVSSNTMLTQTMGKLSGEIQETLDELKFMTKVSQEIETIARQVSEISGQVRMLGLNASIEAARAGQHGKGFAIVAQEIKSLAYQSENSSKQISNQLRDIQKISDKSISSMHSVTASMDHLQENSTELSDVLADQKTATLEINQNLEKAGVTFEAINHDIDELNQLSNELDQACSDVHGKSFEVSDMCINIAKASKEFLRSIQ